ncbi:hypothetical protein ACWNT8_02755 [Pigmentibacter ruber]
MKIRILSFFLFVYFQTVLFANQNEEYIPENYNLFFMKYLEENKGKYSEVNKVIIQCENTICNLNLKNDNQTIFRINAFFQDNFEGYGVVLNSYYDNGSFFENEIYTIEKTLKRTKRWDLFKPSIDGSWLANERSILLRNAMRELDKAKKQQSGDNKNATKLNTNIESKATQKDFISTQIVKKEEKIETKQQQKVEKKEEKKEPTTIFFKPSIDGSWLANERAALLRIARKKMNEGKP